MDISVPHLDRLFDYLIPDSLDDQAVAGCRVRVRFAGRLVDGFLLERVAESDHPNRLSFVERVVSSEPALTPEIATLARAVADRWAGTLPDVLRLAVPPRHARVEAAATNPKSPADFAEAAPADWSRYQAGNAWLAALVAGKRARAVWSALPGEDWPTRLAEAARASLQGGRGVVIVVPDHRDLTRVDAALHQILGPDQHVALAAQLGPAERYRRWLAVRRGEVQVVVGTRSAVFAPVANVGLLIMWDDGDDLHAEPRAPYPPARDVMLMRAHLASASALLGGFSRSIASAQLSKTGWAHDIVPTRDALRAAAPRVQALGDDFELARDPRARAARLPELAWRTARSALDANAPVLVQVPRRGYLPALSCAQCRETARCSCGGVLATGARQDVPTCRWCGKVAGDWRCLSCNSRRWRAVVIGAARTAEELGRTFAGFPVRLSGGDSVLDAVPGEASLVVATPGAEPVADGGYGAALLLDPWILLTRPDLRATEEAVRRWFNAAALVRPAATGGRVVITADGELAPVQALVRWDPAGYAARELSERAELNFPPVSRMASLTGSPASLADFLDIAQLPPSADVLGPVMVKSAGPDEDVERFLIRVSRSDSAELAVALRNATAIRSARKNVGLVRVQLDPMELV